MTQSPFIAHLTKRGYRAEYRAWVSEEDELIYFPLWAVCGRLVGYQRYTWYAEKVRSNKGRYFTWITEEYKPLALWGMDQLTYLDGCQRNEAGQAIYVVEGIWDAIRVRNAGYSCVAVLGAPPSRQYVKWFRQLTYKYKTIALMDNDENNAGLALAKLTDHAILCEVKDMNELTDTQAKVFLDEISTNRRISP